MEDGGSPRQRRSPRSNLLMSASLEHRGRATKVTLRNLSAEGALVEGDHDLTAGAEVVLNKKDLSVAGRIAWVDGRKAGIAFAMSLDPATVLRYVPPPRTRPSEVITKKRPGFRGRMSAEERRIAEELWGGPLPPTR